VYLGAAYLEAEQVIAATNSVAAACHELEHRFGAVSGRAAVLRFHWAEADRRYAEEQRAAPAHKRMADAAVELAERARSEIALREQRIENLRRAAET